jgi:nicotinamide-nucleotide amidase
MFPDEINELAIAVLDAARAIELTVATVESCTGGLVAGALTAIPGSSDVMVGGLVTYANQAKTALAGVPGDLIAEHGAVSEPVARAMAEGGLKACGADVAVAITGIAGPGGGGDKKPIGMVCFALARTGKATQTREERFGELGRDGVRMAAVNTALQMLAKALRS